MSIIGPFQSTWNLHLVALEDDSIVIVHLGFISVFKYATAQQIGLFSGHIDRLLALPIEELKERHALTVIRRKDTLSIGVVFNKILAHRLGILTPLKKYTLSIEDRDKAKEYQCLIDKWIQNERP